MHKETVLEDLMQSQGIFLYRLKKLSTLTLGFPNETGAMTIQNHETEFCSGAQKS
jgi:hypothetical protein